MMFVPVEEKLNAGLELESWQIHTVGRQKITSVSLRCHVRKSVKFYTKRFKTGGKTMAVNVTAVL